MTRWMRRMAPLGLAVSLVGLTATRTSLRTAPAVASTYWVWASLVVGGLALVLVGSLARAARDGGPARRRLAGASTWPLAWVALVVLPPLLAPVQELQVDGRRRSYRVTVPADAPPPGGRPAVLVLHGFLLSPGTMRRLTGADRLAREEGAVVVYPRGTLLSWNDGDDMKPASRRGVDDLAFLRRIVDVLPERHGVDPRRIFAVGFSNGGYVLVRHACALAGRLAAIGVVGAGTYPVWDPGCAWSRPLPALFVLGSADPTVAPLEERFDVTPTRSAELWARSHGCGEEPRRSPLPDGSLDGTRSEVLRFADCRGVVDVRMVTVDGGGHAWPGGPRYMPAALVGPATLDFDATALLWEFFQSQLPRSDDWHPDGGEGR